jgi:hypothetical protein
MRSEGPGTKWKLSDHLHALRVYPRGNIRRYLLDRRLCTPKAGLDAIVRGGKSNVSYIRCEELKYITQAVASHWYS